MIPCTHAHMNLHVRMCMYTQITTCSDSNLCVILFLTGIVGAGLALLFGSPGSFRSLTPEATARAPTDLNQRLSSIVLVCISWQPPHVLLYIFIPGPKEDGNYTYQTRMNTLAHTL